MDRFCTKAPWLFLHLRTSSEALGIITPWLHTHSSISGASWCWGEKKQIEFEIIYCANTSVNTAPWLAYYSLTFQWKVELVLWGFHKNLYLTHAQMVGIKPTFAPLPLCFWCEEEVEIFANFQELCEMRHGLLTGVCLNIKQSCGGLQMAGRLHSRQGLQSGAGAAGGEPIFAPW